MPFIFLILGLLLLVVLFNIAGLLRARKKESPAPKDFATPVENEPAPPAEPYVPAAPPPLILPTSVPEAEPYDRLCDLKCGVAFVRDCRDALYLAEIAKERWAVCSVDIDGFHLINSVKGATIGDYLIINLLSELRKILPEGSLITRISADLFIACFELESESVFQRYSREIADVSKRLSADIGAKYEFRICLGLALTALGPYAYDYDVLLNKAAIARQYVKNFKDEAYGVYGIDMVKYLRSQSALTYAEEYQDEREISLYLSPRIDVQTTSLAALRVFPTWHTERAGIEQDGLRLESGRTQNKAFSSLFTACELLALAKQAGYNTPKIEIFLTAAEFLKSEIAELTLECVHRAKIDISHIIFSVDISLFLIEPSASRAQAASLAACGITVLAEGYVNSVDKLEQLNGSAVSFVRIPRILTTEIDTDTQKLATVNALQKRADSLGISLVYEGIDRDSQLSAVRLIGGTGAEGQCAGIIISAADFNSLMLVIN